MEKKRHQKEWYESWFDSPYYHILYKDRDEEEAAFFVDQLVEHLQIPKGARILDLACGKGRHSIQLHKKGFRVTGVDLSPNSIEEAQKEETEGLEFKVHDMRETFKENEFDYIFNLFSSFGYFKSEEENYRVVEAASKGLKKDGTLVIDFMNAKKALQELIPHEVKKVNGIDFHIDRYVEHGLLIKRIAFDDEGKGHEFKEKLQILFKNDLEDHLCRAGMKIEETLGDYSLAPFDPKRSDRLILIATKC